MGMYMPFDAGWKIQSDSYIDERLILTKEQMRAMEDEFFMPERYIAFCLDDSKWYEFNYENDDDPETGKYRELASGIVKDVKIDGVSILDSEGVADFSFPVTDVLVDGESVVENKRAKIDLSGFQDKLTAGENITISDSGVISAKAVLEGNGIIVDSEGHISIDPHVVPEKDTLPQEVEEIANELGLITISALANYYTSSETYNKEEINELIGSVTGGIELQVVAVLPVTGESNVIYLVRRSIDSNIYDQYVWFNSSWVQVGSTEVDLSQYYTKTEADALLTNKQDKLTAGRGITISGNTITADISDLPDASASTKGVVKYDNITIKKNDDGQLYSVGGGGEYYEGENVYFTTQSGKTFINAEGYTAGDGIEISNSNKISAKVDDVTVHTNRYGEIYMDAIPLDAGDGIDIRDGKISINPTEVEDAIDLADYQKKLTAGANITISDNNVISATGGGPGSEVAWGNIVGSLPNQTDLQNALNAKANKSEVPVVNNGSFIVKRNGVSLGGMSANQATSSQVDIKVPTFSFDSTTGKLTITNN